MHNYGHDEHKPHLCTACDGKEETMERELKL